MQALAISKKEGLLTRLSELEDRVEFWLDCLIEIQNPPSGTYYGSPRIKSGLLKMAELLRVRGAIMEDEFSSEEEAARVVRKSVLMVERFQARLNEAIAV